MAIDNRLQVFNEEGQSVDYDILASDVKFLPDGKDLPTKLAEMEAHQGDGTVTGVKVGTTPYNPDSNGVVDLSVPFNGKVDKDPNKELIPSTDLAKLKNLPTNDQLTTQLGQKANDADVVKSVSVNNVAQTKDNSGNVNIQVQGYPMDSAPTAGNTDHVVSSAGIKTALDAKANAADVPTKTEMSDAIDDALGEAQVTVVPASSVGIISSLGSDSDEDALSASMGKKLKVAVLTILNSLGNYAFPDGKPTIDWGGDSSVTYSVTYPDATVTKVTHGSAPDSVSLGDMLEVTLGTNDDLYVVKDSSVKVYMGGVEQSGVYNASTQKVTLAAVTGNVVIVAEAWTYVSRGLVMHLDGRNRGGTAGRWDSLVNYNNSPLYFKLENCDESHDDYVGFTANNQSKGLAYSDTSFNTQVKLLDVAAASGTVEAAATGLASFPDQALIMHNNKGSGNRILFSINPPDTGETDRSAVISTSDLSTAPKGGIIPQATTIAGYFSVMKDSFAINGNTLNTTASPRSVLSNDSSMLSLFYRYNSSSSTPNIYWSGNLYALRVYNVQLNSDERTQNLAVDRKRFNLGY